MKLETFFDNFAQFVDAPDTVAKMRELVFGFAFTGRLTNKSMKRDGVPDGWENRTIGSIASSMTPGFACSKSHQVEGGHVHLRTHNISTLGSLNFDLVVKIAPQMVDQQKAAISRGDILFNNTNSQELVGKTCLADRDYDYGFSNHITRIRLKDSVDPRFVVFYLTWLRNSGHFARLCTRWINQAAINTNTLKEQMISVPPLVEQEEIVTKINELMSLCDLLEVQHRERERLHAALSHAAIARFDEAPTPANLNYLFHPSYSVTPADLRKTVLNLAVHGKLVTQDTNDQPPTELLHEIEEYRAKAFSNLGRSDRIPTDQAPYPIPDGWIWTTLRNIADIGTGSTPSRTEASFWSGGSIPWINSGLTSQPRISEPAEFVTPAAVKAYRLRIYPMGTLIVALYGQGKTRGQVSVLEIPAAINQACAAVCTVEGAPRMQDYLRLLLQKQYEEIRSMSAGGAQPNLNIEKMKGILVPLPPLAEQHRIVARVHELMDLIDRLEAELAGSENAAKELLNAVIHELLHPSTAITKFPRYGADQASQRAAIGCYAIEHLARNPSFGRVMLMKVCYLSETHLGIPLGWQPMRQAAGPWDPWLQEFESLGTRRDWFTVTEKTLANGHNKIEYTPKKALQTKAAEALTVVGDQSTKFDRLLDLFVDKNTEEAEIITTLFAAWNDFLIDGKTPTDDEITHEVRKNWHQSKERFTPAMLQRWLHWMCSQDLIPKGHSPRTRQQLTFPLD